MCEDFFFFLALKVHGGTLPSNRTFTERVTNDNSVKIAMKGVYK